MYARRMSDRRLTPVATGPLPEPPYPPDVRAKGWKFELDLERVYQSSTWTAARRASFMRPWLLMLWTKAWVQRPCGTLPNDDEEIIDILEIEEGLFSSHRGLLMRGWRLHSDGRLYHPVITECVLTMMDGRRKDREKKAAYRARLKQEKQSSSENVPRDTQGSPPTGTGPGTGTGTGKEQLPLVGLKPDEAGSEPKKGNGEDQPLKGKALRDAAKRVLLCLNRNAGRKYEPTDANIDLILQRFREGYDERELCAIAAVKARQWKGTEQDKYIRPATLYNKTKCAQYRAELPANRIDEEES